MSDHPKIEYVIFDMDGLMIDSEKIYTDVTNAILGRYGKTMTWDIKSTLMGNSHSYLSAEIEASLKLLSFFPDISLTLQELLEERNRLQRLLWPTVPLLPGVSKLVLHLKAHGIPIAIATGSRRLNYELKTGHLGEIFGCFEGLIVCGDDTQYNMKSKPAPDIFLTCARELLGRDVGHPEVQCTPAQTIERSKGLIFEDAVLGMQAGCRAGMSVVWIPDEQLLKVGYSGEETASEILSSMEDFKPERWGLPAYTD